MDNARQIELEQTLTGLGYRLVDCQWSARYGLLKIFVERLSWDGLGVRPLWADLPQEPGEPQESPISVQERLINGGITVEDCALISQHLTRWLMVENIDYQRLEVSSPGLDRRLTTAEDLVRFAGMPVRLITKYPLQSAYEGAKPQRNFRGRLIARDQMNANDSVSFVVEKIRYDCHWQDIEELRLDEEAIFDERYPRSRLAQAKSPTKRKH